MDTLIGIRTVWTMDLPCNVFVYIIPLYYCGKNSFMTGVIKPKRFNGAWLHQAMFGTTWTWMDIQGEAGNRLILTV